MHQSDVELTDRVFHVLQKLARWAYRRSNRAATDNLAATTNTRLYAMLMDVMRGVPIQRPADFRPVLPSQDRGRGRGRGQPFSGRDRGRGWGDKRPRPQLYQGG